MTDLEFYNEKCGGKTIGHLIQAVLKIDNPEDALRFYRGEVARIQAEIDTGTWESKCTAEQGASWNIGWCYGEGMSSERIQMWVDATNASHPVFGTIMPTPEAAYTAGLAAGERSKHGND
jgi:hypothetical protein